MKKKDLILELEDRVLQLETFIKDEGLTPPAPPDNPPPDDEEPPP